MPPASVRVSRGKFKPAPSLEPAPNLPAGNDEPFLGVLGALPLLASTTSCLILGVQVHLDFLLSPESP